MTQFLKNNRTKKRYPINGCIIDQNAPPPLSRAFKIAQPHRQLPASVSLMKYMTPVKNQGETNSCVAHAYSAAYEYFLKKDGLAQPDVSRLYIYYNSRQLYLGYSTMTDSGTTLESALEAVKKFGCCKDNMWPFKTDLINRKPFEQAYQNGRKYLTTEGFPLDVDLYEMKSCLADGYPFVFGIFTFPSFGKADDNQGRVPMPRPGESVNSTHGAHAMLAVGYNDQNQVFTVKNSWGTDWGHNGYCYIPYDYLANTKYCWVAIVIKNIIKDEHEMSVNNNAWYCDSCRKNENDPSIPRYHCLQCDDFDLCEICYDKKKEPKQHHSSHMMQRTPAKRPLKALVPTIEIITTPDDPIQGIHATTQGSDSSASQPVKHYPPSENPRNAIDQKLNTKYLNSGNDHSGLNTGFYVTPQKGKSMVTKIQFTTANDYPERDPITFVLEGSNASITELDKGSSWTGICFGGTGLAIDPGRLKPGLVRDIPNSTFYSSYRLLITSKRHQTADCVQYSGCTLFGKISVRSSMRGASNVNDDEDEENEHIGWNMGDDFPDTSTVREFRLDDTDDWCIETDD